MRGRASLLVLHWAEDVGCSVHTVSSKREELESTCEISKLDKLIGKDGKSYLREYQARKKEKRPIEPNYVYPLDYIEWLSKPAASSVDLAFADPATWAIAFNVP